MTRVKFFYEMTIRFDGFAHDHYFTLRCFPKTSPRQKIIKLNQKVEPFDMLCESWDGYGNTTYIGHKKGNHDKFSVSVDGEALVSWENYETDTNLNMCYRIPSVMTFVSPEMSTYFRENFEPRIPELTQYQMAEFIMHDIYEKFEYCKQVTNVNTGASYAFHIKKGVCQDYAHVMVAFLRMAGLPARYVVGLMDGEGESHAWVEVYCNKRWYGFDPTNDMLIDDHYIIFSKGRDCKDCTINQGKFYGPGNQVQEIKAKVEIIE